MKKPIFQIAGCLLALLLLFGCAAAPAADRETLAPTQNPTPESAAETSASSEAAASEEPALYENDYALLWSELATSYPYLPYLGGKGKDIDEIRERYTARVKEAKNAAAFLDCISEMFDELDGTAHLYTIKPGVVFRYWYSLFVLDPELSAEPDFKHFARF